MPSEYRKQELLVLLGNCILVRAFGREASVLEFAREKSEQLMTELDRDYPSWKEELE